MGGMRNAERRNGAGRHPRRDRPEVITGEQGDGKLSRPVREGANGKGLRHEHLAGDLLHSMRGGWRGPRGQTSRLLYLYPEVETLEEARRKLGVPTDYGYAWEPLA